MAKSMRSSENKKTEQFSLFCFFILNRRFSLLGGRGRMKRYGLSRQYSAISMLTVWKKSA